MQVHCPNCSKPFEVPDNLAGKSIFCTSCGSRIQAAGSKTTVAALSASAGQEAVKKCPYCAETILKAARKCRFCKQDLPEGADSESIRERFKMKERKISEQRVAGGPPPIPRSISGRFRTVTKVLAGITGLFLLLALAGGILPFNRSDDREAMLGLGITFTFLFGIILLVVFVIDLSVPSADKRTSPGLGLKTFLGALRMGRYGLAYACLLDGDKDSLERARQPIELVKVWGGNFVFSDLAGFKQYWKGLCHAGGGQNRRLVVTNVREEKVGSNYALVSAKVRIESYPSAVLWTIILSVLLALILVLAMTKRQEITVTKLMRQVGGQWYVVNGELSSVEDNAWEVAASLG